VYHLINILFGLVYIVVFIDFEIHVSFHLNIISDDLYNQYIIQYFLFNPLSATVLFVYTETMLYIHVQWIYHVNISL